MTIILAILTFVMALLALGLIGLVLLQKSSGQQGMGAAMGGGVADQAFGAETNSILSKNTQIATIIYFVLAFILYLGWQSVYSDKASDEPSALLQAAVQEEAAAEEAPEGEEAATTEVIAEEAEAIVEEVEAAVEEAATVNPLEDAEAPQQ